MVTDLVFCRVIPKTCVFWLSVSLTTDPFLFYVMTEYDCKGFHIVGYFSKVSAPAGGPSVPP